MSRSPRCGRWQGHVFAEALLQAAHRDVAARVPPDCTVDAQALGSRSSAGGDVPCSPAWEQGLIRQQEPTGTRGLRMSVCLPFGDSEKGAGQAKRMKDSAGPELCSCSVPGEPPGLLLPLACRVDAPGRGAAVW